MEQIQISKERPIYTFTISLLFNEEKGYVKSQACN